MQTGTNYALLCIIADYPYSFPSLPSFVLPPLLLPPLLLPPLLLPPLSDLSQSETGTAAGGRGTGPRSRERGRCCMPDRSAGAGLVGRCRLGRCSTLRCHTHHLPTGTWSRRPQTGSYCRSSPQRSTGHRPPADRCWSCSRGPGTPARVG